MLIKIHFLNFGILWWSLVFLSLAHLYLINCNVLILLPYYFSLCSLHLQNDIHSAHGSCWYFSLGLLHVSYHFSLSLVFLMQSNLYTASQRIILKHPPTVKYLPFFNVFLRIRNSGKSLPCHSTLNFPTVSSGQEQWWIGKRIRQDKSSPRGKSPLSLPLPLNNCLPHPTAKQVEATQLEIFIPYHCNEGFVHHNVIRK